MTKENIDLLIRDCSRKITLCKADINDQIKCRKNVIEHPEWFTSPANEIIFHNSIIKKKEEMIDCYSKIIEDLKLLYD